jgi:hypothetical protein
MKGLLLGLVVSVVVGCGGGVAGPKGDKGDPGTPGTTGATGAQGATGTSTGGASLKDSYSCTSTQYPIEHDIYVFTDGTVMTTCSVTMTNSGLATSFAMFKPTQAGAAYAGCVVDLGNPYWANFKWGGGLSSTVYDMNGSTTSGTYALTCTKH